MFKLNHVNNTVIAGYKISNCILFCTLVYFSNIPKLVTLIKMFSPKFKSIYKREKTTKTSEKKGFVH